MNDRDDVVVIGGGVVGLFAAYHLRRAGRGVRVVERGDVGSGASRGNCGYVCPSHVLPLCVPGAIGHATWGMIRGMFTGGGALSIPPRWDPRLWSWLVRFAFRCRGTSWSATASARHALLSRSIELYQSFLGEHDVDCGVQSRGLWMVHRHQKSFDAYEKSAADLRNHYGLNLKAVDGRELAGHESSLRDDLAGAWWFPDDVHLDPSRLIDAIHQVLVAMGVKFSTGCEVERVEGPRPRIHTRCGEESITIDAEDVLVTAGAESPRFEAALGCRIPIVPGKGYSMSVAMPRPRLDSPMIFEDTHVAVTPLGERLRVGSTMSLCGYNDRIDPRRVRRIRDDAASYFVGGLDREIRETWTGWRPMVYDDRPVIDRSRVHRHVWVASGNGMIGLSTAPATGEMVAGMINGGDRSAAQAFSLDRFA